MELYKENMDEMFFNYFEGNLDEGEKEELMNFLHQNPEYNHDFTSWAQSYAHTLEKPEDYGMIEKLTREKQPGRAWNKNLLIFIPAVLAVLFLISKPSWLKIPNNSENELQRENPKVKVFPDAPANSEAVLTKSAVTKKKKNKGKKLVLTLVSEKNILIPDTIAAEEPKKIAAEDTSSAVKVIAPEKVERPTETEKASSSQPINKKKKKFNISLKPNPNFTPLSPDL